VLDFAWSYASGVADDEIVDLGVAVAIAMKKSDQDVALMTSTCYIEDEEGATSPKTTTTTTTTSSNKGDSVDENDIHDSGELWCFRVFFRIFRIFLIFFFENTDKPHSEQLKDLEKKVLDAYEENSSRRASTCKKVPTDQSLYRPAAVKAATHRKS
jgi:heme-binding NEAT domain protein